MSPAYPFLKMDHSASPSALLLTPLANPGTFQPFPDFRAENDRPSVVHFKKGWGGRENDLIGSTFAPVTFGSQSLRTVVEAAAFSGVDFYEVTIDRMNGKPATSYFGLRITGRCGPIDPARTTRITRIQPPPRPPCDVLLGLYFDEATWDGSDFFVSSDGTGYLFVTERVAAAFKKARLKGVEFRALPEYERFA